jgi:hypothetical protein
MMSGPITRALCVDCRRPLGSGNVLSQHPTSHGVVGYRRCACGRITVEMLAGPPTVLGGARPPASGSWAKFYETPPGPARRAASKGGS